MSPPLKTVLRILIDYGALIAFAVVFAIGEMHHDKEALIHATPTLMIASVVAVVLGFVIEKRIAPMPAISGGFALVFGGLTLFFHDKNILKMKVTFVYLAFASALGIGLLFKKNPLRLLMGSSVSMPDHAWRILTIRFLLFFATGAVLNEIIWRGFPNDKIWVGFKIVYAVAGLVFAGLQTPFLMKHMDNPDEAAPLVEPPDTGL
ncbi:MAG TPA: septation protein IspZ [Caulobacteraceae bacterium]